MLQHETNLETDRATEYTLTGLTAGTDYHVYVTAVSSNAESEQSNIVSFTTINQPNTMGSSESPKSESVRNTLIHCRI